MGFPEETPFRLRQVLRACLQRDPKQRVHDVSDVRLAMEGAFETTVSHPSVAVDARNLQVWQRPVPLASAVGFMAITGLAVWTASRPEPVAAPDLIQFVVSPPQSAPLSLVGLNQDLAISPDGTRIIYKGLTPDGTAQHHLRRLDQLDTTPLRGGEGGVGPFFSPDGEWVGFVNRDAGTILQKVSILGGPSVTLAESSIPIFGATWAMDDQVIFGTFDKGLFRVPDGGGEPEALTTLDADDTGHFWPASIPGREAVVFVVASGDPLTTGQLAVLELDTGEVTRLGLAGVSPRYSSTGHLVYAAADGSVRAVPFDAASLDVTGNPVPLIEGVSVKALGAANFSLSDEGRLVYALGATGADAQRAMVWVDRDGHEETIDAPPRAYLYARVSPDGTRVALDIRDQENDIWVWNVARETLTRITVDAAADSYGHWTPDGEQIVFGSRRGEATGIYTKPADGTGTAKLLTDEGVENPSVYAVTPDGTRAIVSVTVAGRRDLVTVPLDGDAGVEPLVSTEFRELNAAISPDGVWVAFQSDASGQDEVYVRPFPDVEAGRWQVSTVGGQDPVWSPDGGELFFVQGTQLMAATVRADTTFAWDTPEMLLDGDYFFGAPGRNFDVAPDGRFLMIKDTGQSTSDDSSPQINVVLNWFEELTARVPVP